MPQPAGRTGIARSRLLSGAAVRFENEGNSRVQPIRSENAVICCVSRLEKPLPDRKRSNLRPARVAQFENAVICCVFRREKLFYGRKRSNLRRISGAPALVQRILGADPTPIRRRSGPPGALVRLQALRTLRRRRPGNDLGFEPAGHRPGNHAATVWEISIKHAIGRGDMPVSGQDTLRYFRKSGYRFLPVEPGMQQQSKTCRRIMTTRSIAS